MRSRCSRLPPTLGKVFLTCWFLGQNLRAPPAPHLTSDPSANLIGSTFQTFQESAFCTNFSAITLTGSHHLLPGPEQSPAPSSLGSHPPYSPLPPCSSSSKSELPQRLEGACEHLSRHVPLLRTFHGSHLTWDKSPRPSHGPQVPA